MPSGGHRPAALLLALATACAHVETAPSAAPARAAADEAPAASAPPADPGAARLAAIRAEVEDLLGAQGALLWETWTRGTPSDLDTTLAAHAALFSRETVSFVREAHGRATGDEARALALLHAFLVGEHLSRAGDAAARDDGQPSFDWDGQRVLAARAPSLLAAEPSAQRRAALSRAWAEAERRQGPAARRRRDAMAAAAQALGYRSLAALGAELRGDSLDALAALADGVLAATDATYRALVDALARSEVGRALADLRGCDLPRVLRAGDDRRLFPADRSGADARAVLAGVGLELADRPGVVIDDAARPGKDARALTLPVAVPGDVRLSYAPAAGISELRGLLHELGAAAFYSRVEAVPQEFRRMGAVTAETWSRLFADLAGDPRWLEERTGATGHELAPVVRATAARRLHVARLLAAHVLDEVARDRDPKAGAAARARLERALLRTAADDELQRFVADRDPLLQGADLLRALLLAAQADAFLSARADGAWWRSPLAGAWLAAAFAEGSRRSPVDLARALGAERVDATALAASTRARLAAAGLQVAASP